MALQWVELLDDIAKLTVKQLVTIIIFLLGFSMFLNLILKFDLNTCFILALVALTGNYLVRKDQEEQDRERKKSKENERSTASAGAAAAGATRPE